ncbi:MAG: NAD(P)-dependent alcohol dehydrogenase [Acidimicrobiales bacterium]|nr:NAD(P)-dependent alcohol dehydrogenase [Acidimicrobiales bacterium]
MSPTTPAPLNLATSGLPSTMDAVIQRRYGAPDALALETAAMPAAAYGEVLIEVGAAGVNRGDALAMRGWPYVARLSYGPTHPRRAVPGTDVAGRVIAIGPGVDGLGVGDHVVGWAASGAFAQYATADATLVVPKPDSLAFDMASAIPTAGVAALQAVRDAGRVASGMEVLVVGASGGVGSFAVQIAAAHLGARVTGVASGRNTGLVRGLGAEAAIDYTQEDFTRHAGRYEVIIDLVGNQPLSDVRRALSPDGTLVIVGGNNPRSLTGMSRFVAAALRSPFVSQRLVPLFSKPDPDDLALLVEMVDAGTIRPVVDRTFDLARAVDAITDIESAPARGKVIITTGREAW